MTRSFDQWSRMDRSNCWALCYFWATLNCAELAERWPKLDKLSPGEGNAFADDLEHACASLPPIKPAED